MTRRFLLLSLLLSSAALAASGCEGRLSADASDSGVAVQPPPGGVGGDADTSLEPGFALTSAVGGEGALRLDWTRPEELEGEVSFALFVGPAVQTLYEGPPLRLDPPGTSGVFTGFPVGTELYCAAGVAVPGTLRFVPSGPILRVRTSAPIYASPTADPTIADGLTPDTAFADLAPAAFTAFVAGRTLWVAEGRFKDVTVPLLGGLYVYGGFDESFDLAARDPDEHRTRLVGTPGEPIVRVQSATERVVLDGFYLDGGGAASTGVDVPGTAAQLRRLVVSACQRGVKLRGAETGDPLEVLVASCDLSGNSLEGLSVEGAYELELDHSRFTENGHEGVDLGKLVAPSGRTARFVVMHCRFEANGAEGCDADLAAPAAGGLNGGAFEVEIRGSDFVDNGLDGLKVDLDYEHHPAWHAAILIEGCEARANLESGVHLDLDGPASAFVHRLASSANREDGLLVTSESTPGFATLSASSLLGNLGAGARASLGSFPLSVANCVFSGNGGGGLVSNTVVSAAHSCIGYVQPAAFSGAVLVQNVVQPAPVPAVFKSAPREFLRVTGASGGVLSVATRPVSGAGHLAELDDDGVARLLAAVGAGVVRLDPSPAGVLAPARLALFDPALSVSEDLRLAPGSAAVGAGLAPPGLPAVDAGPFAGPWGGAPGELPRVAVPAYHVAGVTPPPGRPIERQAEIRISFEGGTPDSAVVGAAVITRSDGADVPAIVSVRGGEIVIVPLATDGWPSELQVEIHPSLASACGRPLRAPVVLAWR